MRRSCGSRPPSTIWRGPRTSSASLAGQVAALKTQARQAVRYRNISGQVRRTEALLFHLRWIAARTEVGDAEHAKDEAVRVVAARTGEQAASFDPPGRQSPPGCRPCARPRPEPPPALQRLVVARETLEREEARAKERIGELDRRIEQFAADLAREQALAADAAAALQRLDAEEKALVGGRARDRTRLDRRQRAGRGGGCDACRFGKILYRIDRRARRSDRAPQSAADRACASTSSAPRGSKPSSPISKPALPRPTAAQPDLAGAGRSAGRSASRARRSGNRGACRGSRASARPRRDRRRARAACRRREAACSGSKPKPRPSASCSRSRARISGRR